MATSPGGVTPPAPEPLEQEQRLVGTLRFQAHVLASQDSRAAHSDWPPAFKSHIVTEHGQRGWLRRKRIVLEEPCGSRVGWRIPGEPPRRLTAWRRSTRRTAERQEQPAPTSASILYSCACSGRWRRRRTASPSRSAAARNQRGV